MTKLPVISGREAVKVFEKLEYRVVRRRGSHRSHIRLRHPSDPRGKPLTIPDYKTLKPGLLRHLIADAGITVEEFVKMLKGEKE